MQMCGRAARNLATGAILQICALCLSAVIHYVLVHTVYVTCTLLTNRTTSFYFADKRSYVPGIRWRFVDEKNDEKCARIIYLWVSLRNEAPRQAAGDGLFLIQEHVSEASGRMTEWGW